jgi:hypothetical protein
MVGTTFQMWMWLACGGCPGGQGVHCVNYSPVLCRAPATLGHSANTSMLIPGISIFVKFFFHWQRKYPNIYTEFLLCLLLTPHK